MRPYYASSFHRIYPTMLPFPGRKTLLSRSVSSIARSSSSSRPFLRAGGAVLSTTVAMTAGVGWYMHEELGGWEGLQRAGSFYSFAIPAYLEYRFHMFQHSEDGVWDELDKRSSQEALDIIYQLQGFYIKCGQMCASNIGNAFPPIWQETMSVLQDQVPPQSFETIRSIVDNELGFEKTFASFDRAPIGSASIGQVHRATLHDGREVVVKVRYPNVERLLRGDVRTIKMFAQVAQPVHVPALEEIEHQFQTEFDYRREAEQLETVRTNLTEAGLAGPKKLCSVPKPYMEYCTKCVLVMEELKGEKLAVALQADAARHAARAGQSVQDFIQEQYDKAQIYELEHGKRWQGPSATEFDQYISLLDGQRRWNNFVAALYNASVGWWSHLRSDQSKDTLPINTAKLVDDLLYIHGHQVLVSGFLNGDPHPGNILLSREPSGHLQLGLIDFGQVKRLSKEQRHLFARIIIALDDDNKPEIVRLLKEAGFRSKKMDPDVIYLYGKVGYDQDNRQLTNGLHIQLFMEDLERRDPIEVVPKDFVIVARASLILRGLSHALLQSRSVAAAWRPLAEEVLAKDI